MKKGDQVTTVLPNGFEQIAVALAAFQAGFYYTPVNWHLVGPEIAYIVDDSETKVFIVHERFASEAVRVVPEIDVPDDAPLQRRQGRRIPAVRRAHRRSADARAPTISRPARTCSTHRARPVGRRACGARCRPSIPTRWARHRAGCSGCSTSSPTTTACTSPRRRCTTRPSTTGPPRRCSSATRSC